MLGRTLEPMVALAETEDFLALTTELVVLVLH
jgi:hypothetical protein